MTAPMDPRRHASSRSPRGTTTTASAAAAAAVALSSSLSSSSLSSSSESSSRRQPQPQRRRQRQRRRQQHFSRNGIFAVVAAALLLVTAGPELTRAAASTTPSVGPASEDNKDGAAPSPSPPPKGTYYQDPHGYLCIDGTCYDGNHQDQLVRDQLYKKHVCLDVRADLCQSLENPGEECHGRRSPEARRLRALCPVTCRSCHDRIRTLSREEAEQEEQDGEGGGGRGEEEDDDDNGDVEDGKEGKASHRHRRHRRRRRLLSLYPSKERNQIPSPMRDAAGSALGVPQLLFDDGDEEGTGDEKQRRRQRANNKPVSRIDIQGVVDRAVEYVEETVLVDDQYWTVRDKCKNRDERCAMYAALGWCEEDEQRQQEEEGKEEDGGESDRKKKDPTRLGHPNVEWMQENCAPVCQTCEMLHYLARCPVDYNQRNAWYPGDLHEMFVRIATDPEYQQYHNVTVLSRPRSASVPQHVEDANVADGPWLMVLENFTTLEEANKLIELGGVLGYERSEDVGDEDETGEVGSVVSTGRTSTNAWCEVDACENDPVVQPVIERMEKLTGLSRVYAEHLQLLRYEVGQFYEEHHDYIEIDRMRYSGVRILTVFLYLNDVEEGGETHFPLLGGSGDSSSGEGLKVRPKLGRVVLWPSVLDDDPHLKDGRTNHQALPVLRGIKYGANAWFHQRHLRTGYEMGC